MNSIDLKGNRAIVTGAAQGIGYAITQRLLGSGAQVAMWDRDVTEMDKAAQRLGNDGPILTVPVDVSDPASVEKARETTVNSFGTIDILVNNAGIGGTLTNVEGTTSELWDTTMDINAKGYSWVLKRLSPKCASLAVAPSSTYP